MSGTTDSVVPTLHATVASHAERRGDSVAIRQDDRVLTYRQLDRLANRLAWSLARESIRPGTHVLFLGRNSDAVPVFALGAAKAGVIPVPLNWRLAIPEIVKIAADCNATLLFAEADFSVTAAAIAANDACPLKVVPASALRGEGPWLSDDDRPYDKVADPETIALQIYTSGSSGRPKGVMLSHRALLGINTLRRKLPWDNWSERDITLVQAPLGHIGAFGMMIRALYFGGQAIIHETFEPGATLDAIRTHKVTKLALVPTAIRMLLDHPAAPQIDYASLDSIVYGSAPIAPPLLREAMALIGCKFIQSYGMTETSGPTVALAPKDHHPSGNVRMSSAGCALPATEITIRDLDGQPLETGETGEVWIRSIANMSGYWNMPAETAITLQPDGWVRTGDAGYMDADGYLYVRGRICETINTGGEKVYPTEVEDALITCPDIAQVTVLGIPDPHWGEAVCAFVVAKDGTAPVADTIRGWARGKIAAYKLPKAIRFLPELPQNATGKVDKQALRRMVEGG